MHESWQENCHLIFEVKMKHLYVSGSPAPLKSGDYSAISDELLEGAEIDYISFDFHWRQLLDRSMYSTTRAKKVLITVECRSVLPYQYSWIMGLMFGQIVISSNDDLEGHWSRGVPASNVPEDDLPDHNIEKSTRLGTACMIVANKRSFMRQANYKERTLLAITLSELLDGFTLYGRGWGQLGLSIKETVAAFCRALWKPFDFRISQGLYLTSGMFKHSKVCYGGEVESTLKTFKRHEYALVVENESSYYSEKLLAPMAAENKIIYLGPPLPEYLIQNYPICQLNSNLDRRTALETCLDNLESRVYSDASRTAYIRFVEENLREKKVKELMKRLSTTRKINS